jgi:hypothetical protein
VATDPNPYAAPAAPAEERPESLHDKVLGPRGIGGWLLVSLILLCLHTVWLTLRLLGLVTVLRRPTAGASMVVELLSNVVLLAFTLVVLAFFLRKSRHTPRLVIARVLMRILFAPANGIVLTHAGGAPSWLLVFLVQVLLGVVWIEYFRRSDRVKNTFTR